MSGGGLCVNVSVSEFLFVSRAVSDWGAPLSVGVCVCVCRSGCLWRCPDQKMCLRVWAQL